MIWNRSAITDCYDYFSRNPLPQKDINVRYVENIDITVHGHTGVISTVVCGNQIWVDSLRKTGSLTILPVESLFNLIQGGPGEICTTGIRKDD